MVTGLTIITVMFPDLKVMKQVAMVTFIMIARSATGPAAKEHFNAGHPAVGILTSNGPQC